MKTVRRTFLLVLGLLLLSRASALAGEPPLKVLFIGNSYTYVNDLPALIEGLADAAGGRKIETGQHLIGGCTLERHVKDKKAIEKIQEKKWDVVVLQEYSLNAILHREAMFKYARVLDEEIKKQGAKTVLYLTWARQHIPQMQDGGDPATSSDYAKVMYQMSGAAKNTAFEQWCGQHKTGLIGGLDGAYFDLAKELSTQVAPVGMAWKKALTADPKLVLHQPDKSHPSPTGSYLAACVFYATLLNKSPVGLPGELRKGARRLVGVPLEEATMLQDIAWQAVQEVKQRHGQAAAPEVPDATPSGDAANRTKLPFDTYSGYFVSNKFEPDAAKSFVVIADQRQFDKVFGVAFVMGDKSHRLPKDAFKTLMGLAVIERGTAVWEFKVESVTEVKGVVELRYTTASKKSDTATFACPLIVSVPKGRYTAVRFLENGKAVKTVEIGGRS